MSPNEVSIPAKIKQLREAKGWNQKELAEKADVSPSTVSGVENGRFTPSIDILQRLCSALGISPEDAAAPSADLALATRINLARLHLYRCEIPLALEVLEELKTQPGLNSFQRDLIILLEARAMLHAADDRMPAMEMLYALSYKLEAGSAHGDLVFPASVQHALGDGWFLNGDFVTAVHHFKRGLEILANLALPDLPLQGMLLHSLGQASRMLRHDEDALAYTRQASELYAKYNSPRKIGEMYFKLGEAYKNLNQSRRSAEAFRKSLLHYEFAYKTRMGIRSRSDAMFYGETAPEQTITSLQEELQVLEDHNKPLDAALVTARIAKLCLDLGDLPQAQATIQRAETLSASFEPGAERAYVLLTYAKVLLEAGEYDLANDYAFQASDIYASLLYYHIDLKESLRVGKEAILRMRDALQQNSK
jgi:transcriptional regulator with XRE-family HTH domain